MFWQPEDIIEKLNLSIDLHSVQRVRTDRLAIFEKESWKAKIRAIEGLPSAEELGHSEKRLIRQLDQPVVTIGEETQISKRQRRLFDSAIEALMPWRKGPFKLFGIDIDAEWRSDKKWKRIERAIGGLAGKRILDVGCGNGYYMFRAAAADPMFVLGLDPSPNFLLQFELIQKYLRDPRLQLELLGFEHLNLFQKTFDVAFCMGILYHHPNPLETLRQLRRALRIGGTAVIESQAISGDDPIALFPRDRYAKARNVFFVPTANCLANWVTRAGFSEVEIVSVSKVTRCEQRKTKHMVFESLDDFLDPDDENRTIEGYPAPCRAVVIGKRGTA